MAKVKKEEVAKKTTDENVEIKGATKEGKLKVKKPSLRKIDYDDKPIKVDLSKPIDTPEEESKEEPKVEEKVEDQPKEEKDDKVIEEVQENVEEEKVEEKKVEDKKEETEKPVLEEITEEKTDEAVEDKVEEVKETVEEAVEEAEKTGKDLPENIQKVIDFMNETGGDLDDYVKLNQDYSKYDDMSILHEYYRQTKPHLTQDERNFLIEDSFSFDEEVDEEKDVKRKKLAFKEQVANAKNHMDGLKSKYYEEIKLGSKLAPEQQKAIDFFNRYNKDKAETDKVAKKQRSVFTEKTNNVFNDKFKGFEYNVGEKRFRFNVKDVNEVKETQSDINNFTKKFMDKNNLINNADGYHKALFTAMNSDAIANHFYEQGKADAIKESIAKSKNIDMEPRQNHGEVNVGGYKVRAISGDDSNKLRFKIKK